VKKTLDHGLSTTTTNSEELPQEMVVAVGKHPKNLSEEFLRQELLKRRLEVLLRQPRVVALGEIGIDHTEPPHQWHRHLQLLEIVLFIVQLEQAVIFHCREMTDNDGTDAYLLLV